MEPSVFEFSDFPSFLREFVRARKRRQPWFSLRWLSKRLNLRSHSYLGAVAKGTKPATTELVDELFVLLGLGEEEKAFGKVLLGLQTARSEEERQYFADRIEHLRRAERARPIPEQDLTLLDQWYNIAILELVQLPDFSEDPDWIASRLTGDVSSHDARSSVEKLLSTGLLKRDESGRLIRASEGFTSSHNVPSAAIRNFHRQMLTQANQALDSQPVARRFLFGHTLPVSISRLKEAEELIVEFRRRFHTLMQDKGGEEVYHLAVQFFPLTVSGREP